MNGPPLPFSRLSAPVIVHERLESNIFTNTRMHCVKIMYNLVVLCLFLTLVQAKELDFYVSTTGNDASDGTSPMTAFATLERAKQAVRSAKENNQNITSIKVLIKGGDYQLNQPLVFTPEDSGTETMPITYQAMPRETVQISGGRRITGWTEGTNGIWQTVIPDVKTGKWYFDQYLGKWRDPASCQNSKNGLLSGEGFS